MSDFISWQDKHKNINPFSLCLRLFWVFFKWLELWLKSFCYFIKYHRNFSIAFGVCFGLVQIRLDSQLFVSVTVIAWNPTAVGRIRSSRFTKFFDICLMTLLSFGHVFNVLLLAFRTVILPCFWLKMRLCVSVHRTVTGTPREVIEVLCMFVRHEHFVQTSKIRGVNFWLLDKQLIIHSTQKTLFLIHTNQ